MDCGLGDANLAGQGPHILAKMEWDSLHLCVQFNHRNLTGIGIEFKFLCPPVDVLRERKSNFHADILLLARS